MGCLPSRHGITFLIFLLSLASLPIDSFGASMYPISHITAANSTWGVCCGGTVHSFGTPCFGQHHSLHSPRHLQHYHYVLDLWCILERSPIPTTFVCVRVSQPIDTATPLPGTTRGTSAWAKSTKGWGLGAGLVDPAAWHSSSVHHGRDRESGASWSEGGGSARKHHITPLRW